MPKALLAHLRLMPVCPSAWGYPMLVRALPIGGKNPCYRFSMPIRIALLLALPVLASATPNIVFLVADDLGWNDVGYHGSEIQTPNIDAIAESGVRLERHYSYPWCSPTQTAPNLSLIHI